MVLFHYVIKILALAQADTTRQNPFRFQLFHCRRKGCVLSTFDRRQLNFPGHGHTAFHPNFGNVLVGEGISEVPAEAQNNHLAREMAAFEGLDGVIGMDFYPTRLQPRLRDGTGAATVVISDVGLSQCGYRREAAKR
jgi:hypothetical protein